MARLRWGVLGTSNFARNKMIPALQQSPYARCCDCLPQPRQGASCRRAVRHPESATELIRNWLRTRPSTSSTIRCRTICTCPGRFVRLKPGSMCFARSRSAMSADEAGQLLDAAARYPLLKVMEAFMYRTHPQWQRAKQIVDDGGVGELRTIHSLFSYFNADGGNIRNQPDAGGGGTDGHRLLQHILVAISL